MDAEERRHGWPQTADEFEAAIAGGVRRGVREVFIGLGIDLDNSDAISVWHSQRQWVAQQMRRGDLMAETQRQGKEQVRASVISAIVSGAIAALVAYFVGKR